MTKQLIALAVFTVAGAIARSLKGLTLVDVDKAVGVYGCYLILTFGTLAVLWASKAAKWHDWKAYAGYAAAFAAAWALLFQPGFEEVNGWKWHPNVIAMDFMIRSTGLAVVTCVITWRLWGLLIIPLTYPALYLSYWLMEQKLEVGLLVPELVSGGFMALIVGGAILMSRR